METRRLYRSRSNRMIAGVCGGVAEYFNVEPRIVRIVFVLLFLSGGIGSVLYPILWLLVPEEPAL